MGVVVEMKGVYREESRMSSHVSAVRVVFLDLGDTLVHMKQELLARVARLIAKIRGQVVFVGNFQILEELKRSIKEEWASRNGENFQWVKSDEEEYEYWAGFYEGVLARMGLVPPDPGLITFLAEITADPDSFVCFPEVVETLQELRDRGLKLGIISNAFPSARKILDHLDLTRWFDYLILSYEVSNAKPARDIYQEALDKAGVMPWEAIFIDDRLAFVRAARSTGMTAVWIDRANSSNWKGKKVNNLGHILPLVPRPAPLVGEPVEAAGVSSSRRSPI